MKKWGVFTVADSKVVVVAPCDEQGAMLEPHELGQCECMPKVEVLVNDGIIVTHNDEN